MRSLALLAVPLALSVPASLLAETLPYPAGATFFTGDPPSLVSAETPETTTNWPYPHYYFTFNIPPTSPQSVGQIVFTPDPSGDPIAFDTAKTVAFQGNRGKQGETIPVASTVQDPKTGVTTVVFTRPVPPNTTFTVTLQPYSNPGLGGTYLFRVQAYPAGANPIGLDLGVGRFSFYEPFR